ncbi:hypothetical protein [Brevundimonas diminuta]|uniref:hypothetical protein n=1 Tax=Brevundimonas diminuta TaxID=293 RepID=UPI003D9A39AC
MNQTPPQGDNRYRTHRSVKCYVAELMVGTAGATWYLNESAQRVVHIFPGEIEKVVYRSRFYPLLPGERLVELVTTHHERGGMVMVGGKRIYPDDTDQAFEAYPFIDVTVPAEHARFSAIIAARS